LSIRNDLQWTWK